jgi:maltose-binding protein MalE
MSANTYASTFYPTAVRFHCKEGNIYAIPLEIDGLVVYYNKQLLAKVDVTECLPLGFIH